jgi:hypothetical protein
MLYETYGQDDADHDSVVPLSTSWVCLGPTDSTFFQADAVRGPSIVEFVIATPKPLGNSPIAIALGGLVPVSTEDVNQEVRTWAEEIVSMPISDPKGS